MVRIFFILLMLLPFSVQGFDFSQLQNLANDPDAMQRAAEAMAKEMQVAAECMDEAGLERLKQEGEVIRQKVESLCSSGDRKAAEAVAVDYSRKFVNSAEYKELKKCGEQILSYFPSGFVQEIERQVESSNAVAGETQHICDLEGGI